MFRAKKNIMKKEISVLLLLCCSLFMTAQVGIGTTMPDENSMLDVFSSNKGVLIPRIQLDDVTTEMPLVAPLTNGMLIYSDGGLVLDGFYYWNNNRWYAIGKVPKKVVTTLSDGGTSNTVHTISSDVDKFETYDGDWPNPLILPNASDSNAANRLNEVLVIEKKSTFDVQISSANTNMDSDLTMSNTTSEIFIFDGTKWVRLNAGIAAPTLQSGTYNVGSTSAGWNYYDVTFANSYVEVPSIILTFREGLGIDNSGSNSAYHIKVANASTTGFTIAIYDRSGTHDVFIDWMVMPRTQ